MSWLTETEYSGYTLITVYNPDCTETSCSSTGQIEVKTCYLPYRKIIFIWYGVLLVITTMGLAAMLFQRQDYLLIGVHKRDREDVDIKRKELDYNNNFGAFGLVFLEFSWRILLVVVLFYVIFVGYLIQ